MRARPFPTIPVTTDPGSSLLAQAATAFGGTHPVAARGLRVNAAQFGFSPDAATRFDTPAFDALNAALDAWPAIRRDSSASALRVDVCGPVTLALTLADAGLELPMAMDAARVATVYRTEALVGHIRRVEPSLPLAVVMDERRLVGSMHPTYPLGVRQIRSLLDPAVDAIDVAAADSPVLIGIHIPGRTDLRTVISSGVSMVSVPADSAVAGYAEWIQALFGNGGWMAWGAVPVDRPLGSSAELLWRHLVATWRDLETAGVDRTQLLGRSMIGAADDVARFDVAQVAMIEELVVALADRLVDMASPAPVVAGT